MLRRFILLLVAVLLMALTSRPTQSAETLLLTTGEWPPFFSATLPYGGTANRIISESFALVDVDVEYKFLPWKRAMQTARFGPAVGSAGWLKMPEREKHFLFSDPIFYSSRVFFHRRDKAFDWRELEDVKDMRVAVTLGSADEFPLAGPMASGKGSVDLAQSYASGMRKLAAGRVDLYACNLEVGLFVLKHQVPPEEAALIRYHPRPIFEETNHLIISRRLPNANEIIARFNNGLRKMKESGQYVRSFYDPQGKVPLR